MKFEKCFNCRGLGGSKDNPNLPCPECYGVGKLYPDDKPWRDVVWKRIDEKKIPFYG